MRKALLVVICIVLLGAGAFFGWRRLRHRPQPTRVGWHARVVTVAGTGAPALRSTAQTSEVSFADPFGIAVNSEGNVYMSDGGDANVIWKLSPEGAIAPIAGSVEGYADGAGSQTRFNTPSGLALDSEGNLYVADTGNNRIRRITPDGQVSTIAGDGAAGYKDGAAAEARFDSPLAVAVNEHGDIFVADTYNDRIRKISSVGEVTTLAGGLGYSDGPAAAAKFDTPSGIATAKDGSLFVADTGNNVLRRITSDGQVSTVQLNFVDGANPPDLRHPIALVLTHDGFLYIAELERSRVIQLAPDGTARVIAGSGPGFAETADKARFNQITGIAIDRSGDLLVSDSANYLVRRLIQPSTNNGAAAATSGKKPRGMVLPILTHETLGETALLWPVDPQQSPHEVAATIGEVRGSFDSKDTRDHLHSGLDVFGAYGQVVRAIHSEKVTSPLANWAFGDLNEGLRAGVISYVHIHVGRDSEDKLFKDSRFIPVSDDKGKLVRVRVRRGTRFRPGDALGTINRMYHVHLIVGPPGAEVNPLSLSPIGFIDDVAPTIEKDGIQLFDEAGAHLSEKKDGRIVVHGHIRIVVNAFDRTNLNVSRRRLGLYKLGYQILKSDGSPAPGFDQPRINLIFNRLPSGNGAVKLAYAEESGITVYGSATTRFLYEVTNTIRDGQASAGFWDASSLQPGDYILRIIAADYNGNEATEGRDVLIRVR